MFFKIYSKKELKEDFPHYGRFYGVPVYVNMNLETPGIVTRNFIPEFCLDIVEAFISLAVTTMQMMNISYEPLYKIELTKPIDK